jgi:general secretion pathway protein F
MPRFHYHSVDEEGRQVHGTLHAETLDAAREVLSQRGLQPRDVRITDQPDAQPSSSPLSSAEAAQLSEYLAELSSAGLPLGAGLRAAAAECTARRLSARLAQLADRADAGMRLEELLATEDGASRLAGLVQAASATPRPGDVIVALQLRLEATRQAHRAVRLVFLYPAVVVSLTLVLCMFFAVAVINPMRDIIVGGSDFGEGVPHSTSVMLWMAQTGIWAVTGTIVSLGMLAAVGKRLMERSHWDRLVANLPLIGPAYFLAGLAETWAVAAALLKSQLPLPDALRRTADISTDRYVADLCRALAEECGRGRPIADCMAAEQRLPASTVPLLAWGESSGELPQALESAADLLHRRVRLRVTWLRMIAPMFAFSFVAMVVVMLYSGLLEAAWGQTRWMFWMF